ncbi:PHP domain-containing protein [Paenibacillus arenilitoris]|uniref:PHP domain-containing protein n=1 Tax=Paenibacillus arenilitoris TaxID=2772299 RepID=A0A927CTU9_9BACL|nr:PHP domain-containing protein [Paenibacillus arenilitoris]MBD2871465.1 PHP domain-containing protein [Paenibacillus arenilitoris]
MALARGRADLHTHTTASDGMQSPAENVRLAKEAGLAAVAITDHDTVAGVEAAVIEGGRIGIAVVPGVEVSTVAGGKDIHILGYYTNNKDERWLARLAGLRGTREQRNAMIVGKLQELGIAITMEDVLAAAKDGDSQSRHAKEGSIGRPHIAEALVRKGAVSTIKEAFDRYLAAGAAAYANPPRVHPLEAIAWIKEAGGTSVIAHPGLYGDDALVEELLGQGAQGVEAYHSDHSEEEEERYAKLAEKHGAIVTGGSDFHGSRQGQVFHGAVGSRTVSTEVLDRLKPSN